MTENSSRCVIVGGGQAASQLAVSLRQEGWEGEVVLLSNEDALPYHRPPLSKEFLLGEKTVEQLLIRSAAFYEKHNIQCRTGVSVNRISPEINSLTFTNEQGKEEVLSYSHLALCTGSRARKIPLPGSDLKGVCYLRSLEDVQALQSFIAPGKKAVIIGGGYIGLETAAVLNKLGMQVTVLEMQQRVLERVTAAEISAFFTRVHQEEGVSIHTDATAEMILGNEIATAVKLKDGTELPADLVIIGVGILPNVELAETAGLTVNNGIVVDEFSCTNHKAIVAAGDCTNHPNALLGGRYRLESVPNATDQAKTAAATICGKEKAYNIYPWFWSNQYDVKLQIAGLNQDYDQVVLRGTNQAGRSFVAWYLKNGKLLAADCINRPVEFMTARQLLTKQVAVNVEQLVNENFDLRELLK
ncbi:MAG: FAD-dependent oxidoreductase [Cellvibrionaceae bacterium]